MDDIEIANLQKISNAQAKAPLIVHGRGLLSGRSIFLLVDIDAADVFEAIAEFFHLEHRGECSAEREDVCEKAGRFIDEMNECEELSCTVGACLRVVGKASMAQYCSPEP